MSLITTDQDHIIHVAIELSRSTWLVAARFPQVTKPHLYKINAGDTTALLTLLASLRARMAAKLPVGIACCFEAGRDGFWLHRLLTASWHHQPCPRTHQHPCQPPGATSQDGPPRCRGHAARVDGLSAG